MTVNYLTSPIWPYTLDHGPATRCAVAPCPPNFQFPGLWSIPMYTLHNGDGSLNAAMDPNVPKKKGSPSKKADLIAVLKTNFLNRYNSSRIPMGLYLHGNFSHLSIAAASLTDRDQNDAYKEFIRWTLSFPDVYWISNQKLLAWMQNPTNIVDSLTAKSLDCLMPAISPSNPEICDGIDNDGTGEADEGLVSNCYYPGPQLSFKTCYPCPPSPPSPNNPVPVSPGKSFVYASECAPDSIYGIILILKIDVSSNSCVKINRQVKIPRVDSTAPMPGSNHPTSGVTHRSWAVRSLAWGVVLLLVNF